MTFPKGIDVANYQSATYDTKGVDFVVVKATEGHSYVNPKYAAQVAHARAAGLIVGHYHYGHHGDAAAQAAYFLAHADVRPGEFIAYDWEDSATNQTDRDVWMHAVKSARPASRVLLYCNKNFWFNRDSENYAGDGLWIADPSAPAGHPGITHPWIVHQYSETGGIDHNVANFASPEAFRAWLSALTPKPAQQPRTPPKVTGPAKPAARQVAFPGAAWFKMGIHGPVILAMRRRLIAEGCNRYKSSANPDVLGSGDVASYEAWQRKCGYKGAAATWPPGKASWDKLKVVV